MIRRTRCLGLVAATIGWAPVAIAAETFDYGKETETRRVEYVTDLQVVLEGVNTLDYTYEFKIDFETPRPRPPMGTMPGPGGRAVTRGSVDGSCLAAFNDLVATRRVVFGSTNLSKWPMGKDFACTDTPSKAALDNLLSELRAPQDAGLITVPADSLAKAIRQTGPGGSVTITIAAKVHKTEYDQALAASVGNLDPLPDDQKKAIEPHQKARIFKIEFGPPTGVIFSFGPYLGGIGRTEFDQVRNANHDPSDPTSSEFVVGLSEDSSVNYGVAAYWSTPITKRDKLGISWGVAYTVSNELDSAVNGLLGFYFRPPSKRGVGLIHFGVAVGSERELAGGFSVGGPIGQSEEIPVTFRTQLSWFAGYGFRF